MQSYNFDTSTNKKEINSVVNNKVDEKENEELTERELFDKLVFALQEVDEEKISEVVDYNTNFDINSDYQNLMIKAYSILSYEFYEKEGFIYVKGKHSNISKGINMALGSDENIVSSLVIYYNNNPIVIREFDFAISKDGDKLILTQELLELITCGFY